MLVASECLCPCPDAPARIIKSEMMQATNPRIDAVEPVVTPEMPAPGVARLGRHFDRVRWSPARRS